MTRLGNSQSGVAGSSPFLDGWPRNLGRILGNLGPRSETRIYNINCTTYWLRIEPRTSPKGPDLVYRSRGRVWRKLRIMGDPQLILLGPSRGLFGVAVATRPATFECKQSTIYVVRVERTPGENRTFRAPVVLLCLCIYYLRVHTHLI